MGHLPPPLLEHFRSPRQVGDPTGADARGRAENRSCGDRVELGLWVETGRLTDVRFRAEACSATLAVVSLVCERLVGLTLEEAAALDIAELVEKAGGLPPRKGHARTLVARALDEALGRLRARYP